MRGNISTFISKAKAAVLATALAFTAIGATTPGTVNAATIESGASKGAQQFAESDFGGYIAKANDCTGLSGAKTAKEAFEACEKVTVSGDSWKFGVTVGDYYLDFMSGEVATGGYTTGAMVDVFKAETPLFTATREGSKINYGFDNYLDLSGIDTYTTPFILTGSVSWGVETVCTADIAMACALYEYCAAEAESEETIVQPSDEAISGLYDYFRDDVYFADCFENMRNEANNGVTNGWKTFADANSLIAGSNGNTRWTTGTWEIYISGQDLTSTGLSQGFVTVTDKATGNILRFSFTEEGKIFMQKKVGGVYAASYHETREIESPKRYAVISLDDSGKQVDTELLALAAVVNNRCVAHG